MQLQIGWNLHTQRTLKSVLTVPDRQDSPPKYPSGQECTASVGMNNSLEVGWSVEVHEWHRSSGPHWSIPNVNANDMRGNSVFIKLDARDPERDI